MFIIRVNGKHLHFYYKDRSSYFGSIDLILVIEKKNLSPTNNAFIRPAKILLYRGIGVMK